MGLIQLYKLRIDDAPHHIVIVVIVYYGNLGIAHLIAQRRISDIYSSLIVFFVFETRMINFNDATIILSNDCLSYQVQILQCCWKPRYFRGPNNSNFISHFLQLLDSSDNFWILLSTIKVCIKFVMSLVLHVPAWLWLDSSHVDVVIGENLQSFHQYSWRVIKRKSYCSPIFHFPVGFLFFRCRIFYL